MRLDKELTTIEPKLANIKEPTAIEPKPANIKELTIIELKLVNIKEPTTIKLTIPNITIVNSATVLSPRRRDTTPPHRDRPRKTVIEFNKLSRHLQ